MMPDLVAEVTEKGAVRLAHLEPAPFALEAVGFRKRDRFFAVDRAEARDDRGHGVLDGQYLRAEREAVLRELRHGPIGECDRAGCRR